MLTKISYKNNSGLTIPPHGIMQSDGTMFTTATGDYVMNMVAPGKGKGPYFVDDGGGAATGGATSYGTCFAANEGPVWIAYSGTSPSAGQPVGPARGVFTATQTGGGFEYVGVFDSTNSRVLAIKTNHRYFGKNASALTAGSQGSPTSSTMNFWFPDTTSGTSPVPMIVTTYAALLGAAIVNRTGASTSGTVALEIEWDWNACEWTLIWADC